MYESGWYIVQTTAPEGTFGAGERCWAVMCNGVFQQGFRLTVEGTVDVFEWGPLNGKGVLRWRR